MEHPNNKYIAVAYQLYADIDGKRELIEETAKGQPFIFITGMFMAGYLEGHLC